MRTQTFQQAQQPTVRSVEMMDCKKRLGFRRPALPAAAALHRYQCLSSNAVLTVYSKTLLPAAQLSDPDFEGQTKMKTNRVTLEGTDIVFTQVGIPRAGPLSKSGRLDPLVR
ncbi:hypothetical protein QCA50_006907 [Cerrena zonata]|uniref:Uncharacterized protein n=1 Tax=Cerrena zonata TaxID=2478898 RepID=A0AAW0GK17_9APHY